MRPTIILHSPPRIFRALDEGEEVALVPVGEALAHQAVLLLLLLGSKRLGVVDGLLLGLPLGLKFLRRNIRINAENRLLAPGALRTRPAESGHSRRRGLRIRSLTLKYRRSFSCSSCTRSGKNLNPSSTSWRGRRLRG